MKISKYFDLREFVPKEIYNQFGDKSIRFINPVLPKLCDYFREYFGKSITINNWYTGGQLNYCGYRPPNCKEGAELSSHKIGVAADIHISGVVDYLKEIEEIKNNFSRFKPIGLTTIEDGTKNWIHISCEWTNKQNLNVIPYFKK